MTLRLAFTPGEPAGIGPDLAVMIAQQGYPHEIVAYADPELLQQRAAQLGLPLTLRLPTATPKALAPGELAIHPITVKTSVTAGKLATANANYVIETLKQACDACHRNAAHALITGPVHKGIINNAGVPFSGHTEFFAERTNSNRVVMMLATEGLRVALATTHLPLCQVPKAITAQLLTEIIQIINQELIERFCIRSPVIFVCGLNPHAGEGGHLGSEEIEIIEPTLHTLRQQGIKLVGPLPADTLFTPHNLANADAVLAMYHDQGLPVLKYRGFGKAVNITLGLPIIRTSVDHGTALDLAASGNVDCGSLQTALEYAANMALGLTTR